MRKLHRIPSFKLRLDLPSDKLRLREILPFRRSLVAILIVAAINIVFSIPLVTTLQGAITAWSGVESLFDLTHALFLSAWLLGWSLAPLILTLVLVIMLLGREMLLVRRDVLEIGIGLPGFGLFVAYAPAKMRNLRLEQPAKKSGLSWRGRHIAFDYGSKTINFGSAIRPEQFARLASRIHIASGTKIREGEATAEELQAENAAEAITSLARTIKKEAVPASEIQGKPAQLLSLSVVLLIAANLVPVMGALYFGWKLADVMVLYWAESAVIGFFNICKMAVAKGWLTLFAGPFFLGHYGGFMAVHFLFLYTIFIEGPHSNSFGGDLSQVIQLFQNLWPGLLALFVSHGISFFINYLGNQEYKKQTLQTLMSAPYRRIIFMHLTIIIGGGLALIIGDVTAVLLGIIAVKICIDVIAHLREREAKPEVSK